MPLLWLSCAWLLGILLASWLSLDWLTWLIPALIGIGLALLEHFKPNFVPILKKLRAISPLPFGLLLAALFFGAARYESVLPVFSAADLGWYNGQAVQVTGVITGMPLQKDQMVQMQVDVNQLALTVGGTLQSQPIHVKGTLLANLVNLKSWNYGDQVTLTGNLHTPPNNGDFSYQEYLTQLGISSLMEYPQGKQLQSGMGDPLLTAIYAFRMRAYSTILLLFTPDEAALLAGIILGMYSNLPPQLVKAFQDTGTSHIIAISGFNITIVAGLTALLSGRLIRNRWAALLVTVCSIVLYTLLVGATPSVVRAAIMGGMALLGRLIGRQGSGANSLTFTAALMCLLNPLLPWNASFQLSFAAMLGLVLFADPLENGFLKLLERWIPGRLAGQSAGIVGEYLLVTLATQITTLPVLVYHFQRLSLLAFLANPLVLPPQPAVMVLGGMATLAGMVFLPLGHLLAWIAAPLVIYTNRMVELLASLPNGVIITGEIPLWIIAAYYITIVGGFTFRTFLGKFHLRLNPAWVLAALGLVMIVVWQAVLSAPDKKLHLTFLPVENGPALLIQTPDGMNFLVNGSSSTSQLGREFNKRLSPFSRRLDAVLLANPTPSTEANLPDILTRFPTGMVIWIGDPASQKITPRLQNAVRTSSIMENILEPGQVVVINDQLKIDVLAAGAQGAVLLIQWKNFRYIWDSRLIDGPLLLNDVNLEDVSGIVLVAPTQDDALIQNWINQKPRMIIAGHLMGEAPNGINWLDLTRHGWVSVSTDGKQMWVDTER